MEFKEVEQQVINHRNLGKCSQAEAKGENILEETRDSHERRCFVVEMPGYSPEDYTSKEELKS